MNTLPPCVCNRPQKSNWLKIQCSNCLGVLKDSQNINFSSQSSRAFPIPDSFSKSIFEYLNTSNKSVHKRSCTDKAQQSLSSLSSKPENSKHIGKNPSDPLLIHKANQLSAPACIFGKKEYLKRESFLYSHKNSVNCIIILNSCIWTAGQDYQVMSYSLPSNNFQLKYRPYNMCQIIHNKAITGMATTNNDCLLTSSLDKTVKLWEVSDKLTKIQTFKHKSPVKSLTSISNFYISGTTDSTLHIWDMEKNTSIIDYKEHRKPVNYIESLKINTFLSGSSDCSIKLWDYRSERSISSFEGHNEGISSLKSLGQNCFVSGSWDKSVKIWDLRGMRVVESWDTGQEVNGVDCWKDFIYVAGDYLQVWKKGIIVDKTLVRAKRVKVVPGGNKVVVGSFDSSVSLFKYSV